MTLPDRGPPRKPRRWGLYAPALTLVAIVVAGSGVWLGLRGEVVRRLETLREPAAARGWRLDWRTLAIGGYPFRLDLDLTGAAVRDRGGWSLSAPRLKAEAFVFAPMHWVVVAPAGIVIGRPAGTPITVTAKVLRASLFRLTDRPPRLSVEALGLAFSTPPGAAPFALAAADEFHLHTRAGANDEAAAYVELDRAAARPAGLAGALAGGKPIDLSADVSWSRADALSGDGWTSAMRGWRAANGEARVGKLTARAGDVAVSVRQGILTVGEDGRLRGALTADITGGRRLLTILGDAGVVAPEAAVAATSVIGWEGQSGKATVPLVFQAGQTTLGPVAIGPAPRVYAP